MKMPYQTFSTALAALREMQRLYPHESRWAIAAHELREAFLTEVARDLSGDSLLDTSRQWNQRGLPSLVRKQAG